MEIQLQELIDKIKKDGIENANQEASAIKKEAEARAAQIITDAKAEAAVLLEKAKQESDQLLFSGKAALRNAGRDLTLQLKKNITSLFDALLKESLASHYSASVIEEAILSLVKNWPQFPQDGKVLVSPEMQKKLSESLKGKLAEAAKKGLSVQLSPRVRFGFKIQEKDGSAYYDFSDEAVGKALSEYLSPAIADLLTKE